jgi:hypothetical protein
MTDDRRSAAALWAREQSVHEARTELVLARIAVPLALLACWILVQTGLGRLLLRTASGMWLHELGHAAAAWMCGFPAFPGPWITSVSEERSVLFAGALVAALGWGLWRARAAEHRAGAWAAGAALAALLFGTLVLSSREASNLVSFAGDGGSLVFGAALMATFFAPPGHKLHRDWLRWGLLFLGAGSFADTFDVWWTARGDSLAIPFGECSGGETDATRLVADAGWTIPQLTGRYFGLGVVSLVVLAALQLRHVRGRRAALEELEAQG